MPALIDSESWAEIPDAIKASITSRTFEHFREKAIEAINVGTFDARVDRHLTWLPMRLDQTGWESVVHVVDTYFARLFDEEKRAKQRIKISGEKPILVTVGLATFESPVDSTKVP